MNFSTAETVRSMIVGTDVRGAFLLLKARLADGTEESLIFPSSIALWLLRNMSPARLGKLPAVIPAQPDICAEDWDGRGAERVVHKARVEEGDDGILIRLTLGQDRQRTLFLGSPQAALLLHYLEESAPDLIDLDAAPGRPN